MESQNNETQKSYILNQLAKMKVKTKTQSKNKTKTKADKGTKKISFLFIDIEREHVLV